MGDSFQFYLDLLLIWLLLIDVCVLAANVINRYTKEPSRYGERSFMKYCVAALVALFVAVVLYSFLHPEVRRPIIEIKQFFSLLDKSIPVSHLTITIAAARLRPSNHSGAMMLGRLPISGWISRPSATACRSSALRCAPRAGRR